MRDPSPFRRQSRKSSRQAPRKILRFDPKWQRRRTRKTRLRKVTGALRKALVLALILGGALLIMRWQEAGDKTPLTFGSDFAVCGAGHWQRCVIDGDTLKIGQSRIRLTGYDAPEMDGVCPAEQTTARQAQRALRDWLNAAPYTLSGGTNPPRDKYGRELREARRVVIGTDRFLGQGYLAQHMIEAGLAAPNGWGDDPRDWCAALP